LSKKKVFSIIFCLILANSLLLAGNSNLNHLNPQNVNSQNIEKPKFFSDNFDDSINGSWINPYALNNSDDWEWNVVNGRATPVLKSTCDDYSASTLTQYTSITGVFNISVDLFKFNVSTNIALQLRLLDASREPVAKAGINDRWSNESYQEYAYISKTLVGEWVGWSSELLSTNISKKVNIWRDGSNIIHIKIGGNEVLSYSNTKVISNVELYIEDSWAFSLDQEIIDQTNYHWFDNFYSDVSGVYSDSFDTEISNDWEIVNPIHTDDDWEWVNVNQRAVPKMLDTVDNYSPTALDQRLDEPIEGEFDFSVDIYKYGPSTGTTLTLLLYDEDGKKVAEAGVNDPWSSSYFKKVAQVYTPDETAVGYKSSYYTSGDFDERVRIWRDSSDIIHVSLDGAEYSSTYNPSGIWIIRLNVYVKHAQNDLELINRTDRHWFDNFVSVESPTSSTTTTTSTSTETSTITSVPNISPGFEIFLVLLSLMSISLVKYRRK
jgi:hypothetical protein